jgi:hypothetical protein
MTAPHTTSPHQYTVETIDYKPLSLLAVAGLVVSVIYGVVLVVTALAALFKHEPFFLPGWLLAVPIGAAVLSGAALWHIQKSEGTRAGTKLAKWGLWISIVLGLCYITYHTVARKAIENQADNFMTEKGPDSGFFPRLQSGDVNTAFLYTLTSFERTNAQPDKQDKMEARYDQPNPANPKGRLTSFRDSALVRAIQQAGTVKFEDRGVLNWTYENGSHKIERKYRITTDEAVYEVTFLITSLEPEAEGDKRKWKVEWNYQAPLEPHSRTPLGQKRIGLRQRAFDFLADPKTGWFPSLRSRNGLQFYLLTLRPGERPEAKARVETTLGAMGVANAVPFGLSDAGKFFGTKRLEEQFSRGKKEEREFLSKIKDALAKALEPERLPSLTIKIQPDDQARCEIKNGELHITYSFETAVYLSDKGGQLGVVLLGTVVVAAREDLDPNAADADQQFRVLSAEFTKAVPLQSRGPGGGP